MHNEMSSTTATLAASLQQDLNSRCMHAHCVMVSVVQIIFLVCLSVLIKEIIHNTDTFCELSSLFVMIEAARPL